MIAVIAHWELPAALSDLKAQKKMLTHWTHTLKAFGVENLVLVDVDGVRPVINDSEIHHQVVNTLAEAIELFPDLEHVYVEEGGEPLENFNHPKNAVYIFGSDYGQLPKSTVGVKTTIPLHAHIACGIILFDRSIPWL